MLLASRYRDICYNYNDAGIVPLCSAKPSAGSFRPAEHPPGIGRGAVRPPFLIFITYGAKPLVSNRPNTADRSRRGPNRRPAKARVRHTTRTLPSRPHHFRKSRSEGIIPPRAPTRIISLNKKATFWHLIILPIHSKQYASEHPRILTSHYRHGQKVERTSS